MADINSFPFIPDMLQDPSEEEDAKVAYDKAYPVVMSNQMIRGKQPMRMREQKIFRLLISQIQPDTEQFKTFAIPLSLLSQILGISSKASLKRDIYQISLNLQTQVLAIYSGEDKWRMLNIMAVSDFDGKQLKLRLSDHMLPYLTNLQGDFTSYPITTISNFTSAYAMRIYEILLMTYNRYYRKKDVVRVTVQKLRTVLQDPMDTKVRYTRYYNFKQRVLIPAMEQINANCLTEFTVEFTEDKQGGRDVVELIFHITPRAYYEDIAKATPEELQAIMDAHNIEKLLHESNKDEVTLPEIREGVMCIVDASTEIADSDCGVAFKLDDTSADVKNITTQKKTRSKKTGTTKTTLPAANNTENSENAIQKAVVNTEVLKAYVKTLDTRTQVQDAENETEDVQLSLLD